MISKSMARIYTAIVDAIVTTLTAILPLLIPDPRIIQIVVPLIGSYQVIAGSIIAALTVDVANEARIEHNERMAALTAHVQLIGNGIKPEAAAGLVADWRSK
jgi:hypothetical protein